MPAVAGMDRLGVSTLLTLIILLGVSLLGFFSRLFAVIRFESIIHEFDPWFNYRKGSRDFQDIRLSVASI